MPPITPKNRTIAILAVLILGTLGFLCNESNIASMACGGLLALIKDDTE